MSSPVLARLPAPDGDTVFTVRAGGVLQEAKLAPVAEAAFGAILERRKRRLYIEEVIHGGAAERALLIPGDRIRTVGGTEVKDIPAFRAAIEAALGVDADGHDEAKGHAQDDDAQDDDAHDHEAHDVTIGYDRIDDRGEWVPREVVVPLRIDHSLDAVVSYKERTVTPRLWDEHRLGIEAIELTDDEETRIYGQPCVGVVLTSVAVGGAAYHAGVRPGDRLTAVDGVTIRSIDALSESLGEVEPGAVVQLRFEKGAETFDRPVAARAMDDRRYVDVPVVVHYTKGAEGSSFNLGYIVFDHRTTYRPTARRTPSRDKSWSFLFGFLRWSEREAERKLRFLWLIPISF